MSGDPEAVEEDQPRYQAGSELLGESARKRREILRLTQEDVAERFGGPSVASLRTIENAQSDTYRAKTLFSLDSALGWPRGTSMLMLTGEPEKLVGTDGFPHQEEVVETLLNEWIANHAVSSRTFDRFVDYIVSTVSDQEMETFDIPVSRFKMLTGDDLEGEPDPMAAGEPASTAPDALPRQEEVDRLRRLLSQALELFQPYMDLLDATQDGLDKVRINTEVLARLAEHEELPPSIESAVSDLRNTVAHYADLQMSTKAWVNLAREMARLGGDIERAIGEHNGQR